MSQHLITYRTGENTSGTKFLLYVTGQSHRGRDFAPANAPYNWSFPYREITLESAARPAWMPMSRVAYLWGTDLSFDGEPLIFNNRTCRDLVAMAIEDYNVRDGGFVHAVAPSPLFPVPPWGVVIPPCDRCGGTKRIKTLLLNRYVEDPCPLCGFIDKMNEAIETQVRRAI